MLGEYFTGLLQPWRRVARPEFGLALALLSLPGLIFMLNGLVQGGSGLLGPLPDLLGQLQAAQTGEAAALEQLTNQLQALAQPATVTAPSTTTLVNIPGLLNGLCLLLLTPFLRGRLLDMGYTAKVAMATALVVQLSVFNETFATVAGSGVLPYASVFGGITMVAYLWLSVRPSQPRNRVTANALRYTNKANDDFPDFRG